MQCRVSSAGYTDTLFFSFFLSFLSSHDGVGQYVCITSSKLLKLIVFLSFAYCLLLSLLTIILSSCSFLHNLPLTTSYCSCHFLIVVSHFPRSLPLLPVRNICVSSLHSVSWPGNTVPFPNSPTTTTPLSPPPISLRLSVSSGRKQTHVALRLFDFYFFSSVSLVKCPYHHLL